MDELTSRTGNFVNWSRDSGADWLLWIVAALTLFVGLRFLRALLSRTVRSENRPATAWRNIVARVIATTNSVFLLVLSFVVTEPFVDAGLNERWDGILAAVFMVTAVIQVAFWARVLTGALLEGVVAKNADDASTLRSAQSLISIFANVVIFAIAAIMILDNLGQDVGALIAGLGVGGIAIALAAQNVFKDLFASLSIILDKPFVKGDFIVWDGRAGNVDKIGLKTTRVKALSGEQLVVSNDNLLSTEIQNFKRMAERRIVQKVGVTYSTPRAALEAIPDRLREIVERREMLRFDRAHLSGFGDSSIDFEFVYFVLAPEYGTHMDLQQEVLLDVHRLFEELGADFAFPSRTVYLEGAAMPAAAPGTAG